ncbi:MAG: hypothetical protein AAFN77_15065 [Planctomycetota bacterium]
MLRPFLACWLLLTLSGGVTTLFAGEPILIRCTIGGGGAKTWQGKISFSDATLAGPVKPLAVSKDATAAILKDDAAVRLAHWGPVVFTGCDLKLETNDQSMMHILLTCVESPNQRLEKTIPLSSIVESTDEPLELVFDETGNRLVIARPSYDQIDLAFDRSHLIFRPGERFSIQWRANRCNLPTANAKGTVDLIASDSGKRLKQTSVDVSLDDEGTSLQQRFDLELPSKEGVYLIEFKLTPNWFQTPLGRVRQEVVRRIELIVLENRAPTNEHSMKRDWTVVDQFDSADALEPLVSHWSLMLGGRQAIGNQHRAIRNFEGRRALELKPGGWQATPLKINQRSKGPMIVEVDYVAGDQHALGISLLERDEFQSYSDQGADSGFVFRPAAADPETIKIWKTHRFIVWPNDSQPYILFSNRDPRHPVLIGQTRFLSGPVVQEIEQRTEIDSPAKRKYLKWLDDPNVESRLGSIKVPNASTGGSISNWHTHYFATLRLIAQLKMENCSGVYLPVHMDGGTIYPGRHLASPRLDHGTFFVDGRDPIQKDRVELMLRLFEREGLELVPVFVFNSPIESIEQARSEVSDATLIDWNRHKRQQRLDKQLPIYNPLARSTQFAITKTVQEFVARYQSSDAFGGVAIVCRPDTCTMLPGSQWCYDALTIERFSQACVEFESPAEWNVLRDSLMTTFREPWLNWRANQMTRWYRELADVVSETRSDLNLFLIPMELFENEELASAMAPALHRSVDFRKQMLQLGFDIGSLNKPQESALGKDGFSASSRHGNLVLAASHRLANDADVAEERSSFAIRTSSQVEHFYSQVAYPIDLFLHRNRLAQFDQLHEVAPFSNQPFAVTRRQPVRPSSIQACQRFAEAIHAKDTRVLIDGGQSLATTVNQDVVQFAEIYQRLPDRPFSSVDTTSFKDLSKLPIAVRQLQTEAGTYFYLVNASPWPVAVQMAIDDPNTNVTTIQSFSDRPLEVSRPTSNATQAATIQLKPFELYAGLAESSDWRIADFRMRLPDGADKPLRRRVYELQAKLVQAQNAKPIDVLDNPRFEKEPHSPISGWDTGNQSADSFVVTTHRPTEVEQNPKFRRSLAMRNAANSPIWIRSNWFDVPTTGRLSVSVWVKSDQHTEQPALRIAVEGETNNRNYYRFGSIGSLSPDPNANQVQGQWKRFAVHFDDIPVKDLRRVRIGFDLMQTGSVQVSGINVYDAWLDANDAKAITQLLASTDKLLLKPERFNQCRQLLSNYWAVFLDKYVASEPTSGEDPTTDPQTPGATAAPTLLRRSVDQKTRVPMFRRLREMGSRR